MFSRITRLRNIYTQIDTAIVVQSNRSFSSVRGLPVNRFYGKSKPKQAKLFSAGRFDTSFQTLEDKHAIVMPEVDLNVNLKFTSASSMIVHPHKKNMGEDAYFISKSGEAIGIADGVGAWADLNIDAGLYSRELMNNVRGCFERDDFITLDPKDALIDAYHRTKAEGTCTACILSLKGNMLLSAHIGDSGFMILRRACNRNRSATTGVNGDRSNANQNRVQTQYKMLYQSVEQQHFFNCPVQLGKQSNDRPTDAQSFQVPLLPGDLVIAATDGLFDNLFVNDICTTVNRLADSASPLLHDAISDNQVQHWLDNLSSTLVREANDAAGSVTRRSPFATNARKAGFIFEGGKMDDITVIVSMVRNESTGE